MKQGITIWVFVLLISLMGCERKQPFPLEDFYTLTDISRISLRVERTDYYIGVDSLLVPSITAFDSISRTKSLPDSAYAYFLNGQHVVSNRFVFTKPGSQTITAQFGMKKSNALVISVIDPVLAVQSVQLSLAKRSGVPFLQADGVSKLSFDVALLGGDGKELPIKPKSVLLANGQILPVTNEFRTQTAGAYRITASVYGKVSNVVTVQARPVETHTIVKIPVIFHFINTKPYEGTYTDLLKATTAYYRNTSQPLAKSDNPAGVDTYIEFEPASNDPSGKPLAKVGEHIVTDGPTAYTSSEMIGAAFKNYFWNPNAYLNVFVFNCTNCASEGAAGYAVIMAPSVKQGWSRNATPTFGYGTYVDNKVGYLNPSLLAHEFGHMLSLNHTFNGGGNDDSPTPCDHDSDECEDTPLYARKWQPTGLDNNEEVSCTDQHYYATNPMNYIEFPVSFTYNQRQLMRDVIENGLWLPTPKNRGIGGGRLAASGNLVTDPAPVKPVIVYCQIH